MTTLDLVVVSVLLHEFAHIAVAAALRVRIRYVGLGKYGLCLIHAAGSPWKNFLIALAGPAMNLLLALAIPSIAWGNLVFAILNLVLPYSDGVNMIEAISQMGPGHRFEGRRWVQADSSRQVLVCGLARKAVQPVTMQHERPLTVRAREAR